MSVTHKHIQTASETKTGKSKSIQRKCGSLEALCNSFHLYGAESWEGAIKSFGICSDEQQLLFAKEM